MNASSADGTIIEIRPFKGGWQCFEGPGVGPYWIGDDAKQSATDYAEERAKFGRGEIRVLNPDGSIERVIAFNQRGNTNDIRNLLT
jgi:hypothetical protein